MEYVIELGADVKRKLLVVYRCTQGCAGNRAVAIIFQWLLSNEYVCVCMSAGEDGKEDDDGKESVYMYKIYQIHIL